jgi:hypothetical protein
MDFAGPPPLPTPPQIPTITPPSRRPALSRATKWWLAIAGSVGLIGVALLVTLAIRFWPLRPSHPADADGAASWVRLGKEVELHGLTPANQHHDGVTEPTLAGGLECHALQRYPGRPELYAYFKIDSAFKNAQTNVVTIEIEYFDADAGGHFRLDYDSFDDSNRSLGAYTQSKERVNFKGTQRWRKTRFLLDDARFEGRQNDEADFRLAVVGTQFFLRSVKVVRE